MKAVIDIGSNSVLLLVASRDDSGDVRVAHSDARITRLSEGAAATGVLDLAAVHRTVDVLAEYRKIADQHGAQIEAVATEGLRVANDPEAFLGPAAEALGEPIRLISGDEEARLSYLSVARETTPGPLRVVDIGGASTELVVGEGDRIHDSRSHQIGSVRLTEQLVHTDPPTPREIEAIADAASVALGEQPVAPHPELHGLAGTVTTAAALVLKLREYDSALIDRARISSQQLTALRDHLASVPFADRVQAPVLPAGRADVIVAGITIALAVMAHCGASTLVVRDRGLRYALV